MRFTFSEKKLKASEALMSYAENKISKLDRYFKSDAKANVTFSVEHGRHVAELTVESDGMFYRAAESTSDMYASIDSAVAAIERQIRKHRTKLSKKLRENLPELTPDVVVTDAAEAEEEPEFEIVRTKHFAIKPMSPEEAILQMNLLDHEFYVFRDSGNEESVAVVYRRKNGGYGLIEEE